MNPASLLRARVVATCPLDADGELLTWRTNAKSLVWDLRDWPGHCHAESKCNKPNPFHDPMTLARGSSTKVQLNERSQPTRHAACERAEPTRTKQAHLDHTALKKISSLRRRDIATAPTHHFKKLQPRYGSMQAKGGLRGPYASGPRSRSCCARSTRPS